MNVRAVTRQPLMLTSVSRIRNIFARSAHTQLQIREQGPSESKTIYGVNTAIRKLKLDEIVQPRKFEQTVDIAVKLGVDPRKPNQSVRGVVTLPHGTGKTIRVAVFAKGQKADEARAAGAHVVGAEDLVEQIQKGVIDFDRCVATPDMMPLVGRIGRILGPRGLMPNPKLGSVTPDVVTAVQAAKGGQVEFRVEKQGVIHAGIGKLKFGEEELIDNIRAFMVAIMNAKPEGAKGTYIKQAHLSSTMGKGYKLDVQQINPQGARFMRLDNLPEWESILEKATEDAQEILAAKAAKEAKREKIKAEKKASSPQSKKE